MSRGPLTIAACAPASYGFVAKEHEAATERMIAGQESRPQAIREHVDRLLDHHTRILTRAGEAGAQLAVLPEDILRLGGLIREHGKQPEVHAAVAAADNRCLERLAVLCRQFDMCIVAGIATAADETYANTAVMLDADGAAIASYAKTHLPQAEAGIYEPGNALPVFDTPIGRIGLLICWDLVFPEPYGVLARQGAELIVQPTFGHWTEADDITARCRARDWSVPLAIGMWGGCASIVDAEGNFAARTGRVGDSLALATLALATPRQWLWMRDTRAEMLAQRRPKLYYLPPAQPDRTPTGGTTPTS